MSNPFGDPEIGFKGTTELKFEDEFKPDHRLPDSQQYLQSLERKLAKIKGINGQSSKDMVTAFEKKKDDLMYKFINSVHDLNQYDTDSIEKNNAENSQIYSLIERKIFPEKHAISNEELQKLIEADLLNKIFQDMNKEHDQDK